MADIKGVKIHQDLLQNNGRAFKTSRHYSTLKNLQLLIRVAQDPQDVTLIMLQHLHSIYYFALNKLLSSCFASPQTTVRCFLCYDDVFRRPLFDFLELELVV